MKSTVVVSTLSETKRNITPESETHEMSSGTLEFTFFGDLPVAENMPRLFELRHQRFSTPDGRLDHGHTVSRHECFQSPNRANKIQAWT